MGVSLLKVIDSHDPSFSGLEGKGWYLASTTRVLHCERKLFEYLDFDLKKVMSPDGIPHEN